MHKPCRRACGDSPGYQQRSCFDRETGDGMPRREYNKKRNAVLNSTVFPFVNIIRTGKGLLNAHGQDPL